uniref:Variable surface glycoprotein n=1 Tax=Trypanosoma congolense TaxID=5692 RepID=Q01270_TRYCO|nr:variable surface glycoprotein [Trypanosoma congolense type Savannah]
MFPVGYLTVFFFVLINSRFGDAAAGDNAIEFGILCKLYNIAENASNKSVLPMPLKARAEGLFNDLLYLNVLSGSDTLFDYGEDPLTEQDKEKQELKKKAWEETRGGLEKGLLQREGREQITRPTPAGRQRVARRIQRVYEKAKSIKVQLEHKLDKAATELASANTSLIKAVFGEAGSVDSFREAPDAAFDVSTGTGDGCGNTDGGSVGEPTGISLVNDFTCLCVGRTSGRIDGAAALCEASLTAQSGMNVVGAVKGENGWQKLQGLCRNAQHDGFLEPENIHASVEAFGARIGRVTPYKLGGTTALAACTGGTEATALCVDYKSLIGGGKGLSGIPWVKRYLDAAQSLRNAHGLTLGAQNDLTRLEALHHSGLDAFESESLEGVSSHKAAPVTTAAEPSASTPTATNQQQEQSNSASKQSHVKVLHFSTFLALTM